MAAHKTVSILFHRLDDPGGTSFAAAAGTIVYSLTQVIFYSKGVYVGRGDCWGGHGAVESCG
jgi:hypothetical protein